MPEYSTTLAERDALRAISRNFFIVKFECFMDIIVIPVIANDEAAAKDFAEKWANEQRLDVDNIIVYPTLNAIEGTIV